MVYYSVGYFYKHRQCVSKHKRLGPFSAKALDKNTDGYWEVGEDFQSCKSQISASLHSPRPFSLGNSRGPKRVALKELEETFYTRCWRSWCGLFADQGAVGDDAVQETTC